MGSHLFDWCFKFLSPLARANAIQENETNKKIAKQHNKSVPQVVLRWHYQLGAISLPKSASPSRQLENIQSLIFRWLKRKEYDGRMNNQDPATYEEL